MHRAVIVWVVCACLPVCIVACFVGFWGSVFAGSASLHDWFLHFLESAFSVTFSLKLTPGICLWYNASIPCVSVAV